MFKRTAVFFALLASIAFSALPAFAAQSLVPLEVRATRQSGAGVDRTFEFDVSNKTDHVLFARGRVVLLNVYDASLPVTIQIQDVRIGSGSTATITAHWSDSPLFGQVRALLVLNDGQDPSLIQPFVFWVFPARESAMFIGGVLLAIALALLALRLPRFLKARVPADMVPYVIEDDDTVMTVAVRFDMTWQDIVRANRLKPPYMLKQGERIFIPKHGLRRPEMKP